MNFFKENLHMKGRIYRNSLALTDLKFFVSTSQEAKEGPPSCSKLHFAKARL